MNANLAVFKHRLSKVAAVLAGTAVLCGGLSPGALAKGVEKPLSAYGFKGLEKRTDLDHTGLDVVEALKYLATQGDLNIVASEGIIGTKVNLLLDNVTIGDALETILAIKKLAYMVQGDIIRVMTQDEYRSQVGVDFSDNREMKAVKLENVMADKVAKMLENVKSDQGTIVYDNDTSTLILKDIPVKLAEMEEVIGLVDKSGAENETETFVLQYGKLEEVLPEVAKVITPETGTMQSDKRTKTIIVSDTAEKIGEISRIIASFDKAIKSVLIEARIVSVQLDDQFQFGIDWDEISKWTLPVEVVSKGVMLDNLMQKTLSDGSTENGLITSGTLNQNFVLDILDTFGDTEIISDPRISVESGKEAVLQVVTSEAYEAGSSEVDSGGVTTSYTNFEFIDVGVTMSVLPEVNEDGYISMRIKPEVSEVVAWYGGGEREAGAVPVVRRSTAETTVSVKDGVTVMIAGLIREAESQSNSKVPILGDIYGIGKLFSHTSQTSVRQETIIFLTPRIVTGDHSINAGAYSTPTLPSFGGAEVKELKGLRE